MLVPNITILVMGEALGIRLRKWFFQKKFNRSQLQKLEIKWEKTES